MNRFLPWEILKPIFVTSVFLNSNFFINKKSQGRNRLLSSLAAAIWRSSKNTPSKIVSPHYNNYNTLITHLLQQIDV